MAIVVNNDDNGDAEDTADDKDAGKDDVPCGIADAS